MLLWKYGQMCEYQRQKTEPLLAHGRHVISPQAIQHAASNGTLASHSISELISLKRVEINPRLSLASYAAQCWDGTRNLRFGKEQDFLAAPQNGTEQFAILF